MTARCVLRLDGREFHEVVRAEILRDLEQLCCGFEVRIHDHARMQGVRPAWWRPPVEHEPIRPGARAEILLDGELALDGWVDCVEVSYGADQVEFVVRGRDRCADLVDCCPFPDGPAELSGLVLPALVGRICAPFGVGVRCDVPAGAAFPRFGLDPCETALGAIEKACRQRAVLAVGDGLGTLCLTRGGSAPAPEPLVFGENILAMRATFDHGKRFRFYVVKGQTQRPRSGATRLDRTASPLTAAPPAARPGAAAAGGPRAHVAMNARAEDPAVLRRRTSVSLCRAQSGGASLEEQAQWRMRTARAQSEMLEVTVGGWHGGEDGRMWRLNERAVVDDPLSGASAELLVAALRQTWGDGGARTELRLCGLDAFDVLREGEERDRRRTPRRRPLDGAAAELTTAPPPPRSTR